MSHRLDNKSHFVLGNEKPDYTTTNRANSVMGDESDDDELDEVSSVQGSVWDPDVLRNSISNTSTMQSYNKASHFKMGSDNGNYSTTNGSLFRSPKMLKLKSSLISNES